MGIDGISALLFVLFLALFLWLKRKRVQLNRFLFPVLYVIMYRSSFGLRVMDWLGRLRLFRFLGYVSVVVGFIVMLLVSSELVYNTVKVFVGKAVPDIQPVLPVEVKGVFFVPFLYWIISIFLLALVHEFAHGILSRAHGIKVNSSGFAFLCLLLPVIPAAFVEPDEFILRKRPYRQQLSIFAVGSFANLLFAGVMFGLLFVITPVLSSAFAEQGAELVSVSGPALAAGLKERDIIQSINGVPVVSSQNITFLLESLSPGDIVVVKTVNDSFTFALGSHPDTSKAFMGVQVRSYFEPRQEFVDSYGAWLPPVIEWVSGLVFWLLMLNVGIGLFNLLPIGPLDGGRMFQLVCFRLFKNKNFALRVWAYVSLFFVIIIIANLVVGFLR